MGDAAPRAGVYLSVAVAAAAGGLLRHAVSVLWLSVIGGGWPWPTLIVNVAGCALIAAYWRAAGPGARRPATAQRRAAVMTGFCGGLTTMSMFGLETVLLVEQARWFGAAGYVAATAAGSLAAVALVLGRPAGGTTTA